MFDSIPCTDHFELRCRERGIPLNAHLVVVRYGRRTPGKQGAHHHRIGLMDAWRLKERGVNVFRYAEITVVLVEGVAVTAYRTSEEDSLARGTAPRIRTRRRR